MKSSKETYKGKRNKKILTGLLLLTVPLGGSLGVSFADEDVKTKLTNWFDNKGQQSISIIESAILNEKELQKKRLKEELELEMSRSESDLNAFTASQKEIKIQALKAYTDNIIANIDIDTDAEKQQVLNEINQIMNAAMEEINAVDASSPKKLAPPATPPPEENKDEKPQSTPNKEDAKPEEQPAKTDPSQNTNENSTGDTNSDSNGDTSHTPVENNEKEDLNEQ